VIKRDPAHHREMGEGQRYLALGLNFGLGIVLFALAGVWLDRRLGSTPAFTLGGTVLGAVLSFLNAYWKLAELERKRRERGGKE
jgi:F0F1-type ATP synthase assembly protein I